MKRVLSFEVLGYAEPQGSKKLGRNRRTGQALLIDDNPDLRPWRNLLAAHAMAAKGRGWEPFDGPVELLVTFRFARPASHYGSGRNAGKLKPSAPHYKKTRPDTDKLLRAVHDALQDAKVITEDARIVHPSPWKLYVEPGERPGVVISCHELEEPIRAPAR